MENEKQDRARKIESEFARVGLPMGRHGNTRDNAELLATKAGTLRSWLAGTRHPPDYPFAILKLWGMLDVDQQREYRRWVEECVKRGDYAPAD